MRASVLNSGQKVRLDHLPISIPVNFTDEAHLNSKCKALVKELSARKSNNVAKNYCTDDIANGRISVYPCQKPKRENEKKQKGGK